MAEHVVKMPDIGEGIAEVELVAWHVAVGDRVGEDQPLSPPCARCCAADRDALGRSGFSRGLYCLS